MANNKPYTGTSKDDTDRKAKWDFDTSVAKIDLPPELKSGFEILVPKPTYQVWRLTDSSQPGSGYSIIGSHTLK